MTEPMRTPDPGDGPPETIATYLRLRGLQARAGSFRRKRRRSDDDERQPFTSGRDPRGLGEVIAEVTRTAGWDAVLAQEDVVRRWEEVAGTGTAEHSRPVSFMDGVLTVQADSTAWARQLHVLRSHILTEIVQRYPQAGVKSLRFIGPDVPSWKWGTRAIPGRGPRDTYG